MIGYFNSMAGSFFAWLWPWVQCLSYWVAAIGGIGSYMIYLATKDRKFASWTIAAVIIYILIEAAGTVI